MKNVQSALKFDISLQNSALVKDTLHIQKKNKKKLQAQNNQDWI